MPVPDFILDLRAKVGHAMLWLSGATAVILRDGAEGPEVLLVRRSDDGQWSPVCGIVDPGEDPHVAAIREAAEEASVVVEVERLAWLNVTDPVTYDNGDVTQYIDHTFRCRWVAGDPVPGDGEASDARFFPVTALPAMPRGYAERIEAVLADRAETLLGRDWLRDAPA
ncbi:MAG: NUDIX domain-containing protein [Micropruina sp.]|uniref:NUDIX hydrolase n=1 Tax=Micropruina sp. TaxID=2737536 RepID=UPI0039E70061